MRYRIAATVAVLALAGAEVHAADEVSLVGTWVGQRERAAKVEGWRDGTTTMVVTEQRGRTFTASLERANPEGDIAEPLWGAFTPGGRLMMGADEEGTYLFELVDADTLDYCYTEAGTAPRAVCARLIRQR